MESKEPVPSAHPGHLIPHWLEDLGVWFRLEGLAGHAPPAAHPVHETPHVAPPAVAPSAPHGTPVAKVVPPAAARPPQAIPVAPVAHAVAPPPMAIPVTSPATTPAHAQPPAAAPAKSKSRPLPAPSDALAEKAVRETGFDPRTGQICDPVQFQKWKHDQATVTATAESTTNASLMDGFRKGRLAVEQWVDEEHNHALVLHGSREEIQRNPEVVHILGEFTGYGPVMKEKLLSHLAFMVENHRKYFAAHPQ
jgi:hypothetical protein